ncbi:MAG: hypothetical protein K0S54_1803 [Alphaproteobacteria bacterium]|nr:hypothetical protein [Alphaproteobacteria bacterium]
MGIRLPYIFALNTIPMTKMVSHDQAFFRDQLKSTGTLMEKLEGWIEANDAVLEASKNDPLAPT